MPAFRFCLPGALAAVLSACAAPAPKPIAAPAEQPAFPVDGVYHGTSTRFRANSRSCPHPGLVTLYVQDRQFFYRWSYAIWVTASIEPDGTVDGAQGDIELHGRRDGRTIEGDVTTAQCGLHFTVREPK